MHKTRRKRPLILLMIIIAILAIFIYKTSSIYPFLFQLVFNQGVSLKQTDNKINILILGIGGGNHDGTNLTDTIMLANIDEKNNKVTLISIPRDLWFPDIGQKINTAYQIGLFSKKPGAGLVLAKAAIGKITGQNIDYAIRLDFSGFVKAVDTMGGLDINVDKAFDDYQYPIDGKENDACGYSQDDIQAFFATDSAEQDVVQKFNCRYKHVHFDKGVNHMDGETALEYVRSRHAVGDEGTDFARSNRQSKVIKAFKDKILSSQTLLNPAKVINLYETLKSSIDTDIKQDEFDDFIRLAQGLKSAQIQTGVLDTGDESKKRAGLLINPQDSSNYNLEWVLIPRVGNGNFTEIQKYINCEIKTGNCLVPVKPQN